MKIFFILILTPIIFSSENEINKTWVQALMEMFNLLLCMEPMLIV